MPAIFYDLRLVNPIAGHEGERFFSRHEHPGQGNTTPATIAAKATFVTVSIEIGHPEIQ